MALSVALILLIFSQTVFEQHEKGWKRKYLKVCRKLIIGKLSNFVKLSIQIRYEIQKQAFISQEIKHCFSLVYLKNAFISDLILTFISNCLKCNQNGNQSAQLRGTTYDFTLELTLWWQNIKKKKKMSEIYIYIWPFWQRIDHKQH